MRILQLTPGTGHFYCGNCLREKTLATALKSLGHEVTMAPLYLPVLTEDDDAGVVSPVFLGGVNLYLNQRVPLYARLPRFLTRLLDRMSVLRFASRLSDMTDPARHADMTLAVLRGDHPGHRKAIQELAAWVQQHGPPDVITLCNVLLAGLAPLIRSEFDVPVLSTLHGEDAYLDALPDSHREQAWATLRGHAATLDGFIPVSAYYGDLMRERLELDAARVHVVHNGISMDGIPSRTKRDRSPQVIGYLARMCAQKGLHTLVDAFIHLRQRDTLPELKLMVGGVMLRGDRGFVREQQAKLRRAGVLGDVAFAPNLSREEKLDFLTQLDALSVPATYGEAFGLYVLEALAHGVPVVQPRHGAFPELIERTGGGLLCEPDDPVSLADGIERVLTDADLARTLAERGRASVLEHFSADRMARDVAVVLQQYAGSGARPARVQQPVETCGR